MESESSLYNSALEQFACENYTSALKSFNSLIEKNASNAVYLISAANCELQLKNYDKALDLLSKAENIDKNSSRVNFLTGVALFKKKKFVEAKVAFTTALQIIKDTDDKNKITLWCNKTDLEMKESGIVDYNAQTDREVKIIYNWIQTPTEVSVEITANKSLNGYEVQFESKAIKLIRTQDKSEKCKINLTNSIVTDKSTYKVNGMKIEIQMQKEIPNFNWVTLELGKGNQAVNNTADKTVYGYYPSSSKVKKDWNQLDKELDKELKEDESKDANEGMMNMFRQIYERSDEKTRRAMIKSFQTSGGTVLSTDWNDVKDKDYEGKDRPEAPKGQEWRKYDE